MSMPQSSAAPVDAPSFTVIMIFLNAAPYIDEAIGSVLAQTETSWELVLVDDGSTDESTAVARAYAQRFPGQVRYIEHAGHVNLGMSAARNAGLAVARGDYIAFLDADDVYLPERLARHREILDAHPDVDVVQSRLEDWYSWRADGGAQPDHPEYPLPIPLRTVIQPPGLLTLMLDADGATCPGVCSISTRRRVMQKLGGYETAFRSTYEDQVMLAKLYLSCTVYAIDAVLARYRLHDSSSLHQSHSSGEYTPGRPHAARRRYLEWLQGYVEQQGVRDPSVRASLDAALWPYRHPRLWLLWHLPQEASRLLRHGAARLLPPHLLQKLIEWRGRQKLAAALARVQRAGARNADIMRARRGE